MNLHNYPECPQESSINKSARTRHVNSEHKTKKSPPATSRKSSNTYLHHPHPNMNGHVTFHGYKTRSSSFHPSVKCIWLKTNSSMKNEVSNLHHQLLLFLISMPNTANVKPTVPSMHKIEVVWKLMSIFESLTLYSIDSKSTKGGFTKNR